MAGPPLINNRTQRSCSRLVAGGEVGRKGKTERKMENRRPEKIKRDARTRVVLFVSLPSNGKGVGRSRGWKRGTGTGNGFYAQSEIYGGRYARAKIILISERKGGKVSQAGWLAGSLALLRAGDIKYNHNNKRPHTERHCWLCHPLTQFPLRLLFPPPSSRTHAGWHTYAYIRMLLSGIT